MMPKLFDKTATTFTTDGIGRLKDCLSCEVTEERNGVFDLEMVYLAGGQWYDQIELGSLVVVKPYEDGTPQAFRVYEITKPINRRVTIYAHHISYDMNYIPVRPFSATGIQNALTGITTNATEACPFTLTTTITNEETAYILTGAICATLYTVRDGMNKPYYTWIGSVGDSIPDRKSVV